MYKPAPNHPFKTNVQRDSGCWNKSREKCPFVESHKPWLKIIVFPDINHLDCQLSKNAWTRLVPCFTSKAAGMQGIFTGMKNAAVVAGASEMPAFCGSMSLGNESFLLE